MSAPRSPYSYDHALHPLPPSPSCQRVPDKYVCGGGHLEEEAGCVRKKTRDQQRQQQYIGWRSGGGRDRVTVPGGQRGRQKWHMVSQCCTDSLPQRIWIVPMLKWDSLFDGSFVSRWQPLSDCGLINWERLSLRRYGQINTCEWALANGAAT